MITYRFLSADEKNKIELFLREIDKSFPVPLSEKIELNKLAQKLVENGYVYMASDGDRPVGMFGFYANDVINRSAYGSVLGVITDYRRQGISKKLLEKVTSFCRDSGMSRFELYTHKTNTSAVTLYEKSGFVRVEDSCRPNDIKFVKEL